MLSFAENWRNIKTTGPLGETVTIFMQRIRYKKNMNMMITMAIIMMRRMMAMVMT